ncbi:MAG TPA: hypothetical protein DGT21_01195 [Armatimonadetes bacterium]|jgi:hypothetical protein|nr:hypothetical protein [Armatimonadota bacterium]
MAGKWRTVRLFVSSTFRDMAAEREYLVQVVFPELRERLLQHKVHFVDVDLRWGVTAEQDALAVCREIIDECRPWFLCLLGERYGWVPPDAQVSSVAQEIDYAVLRQPDHASQFFYFRDPSVYDSIPAELVEQYREPPGESADRLGALKQQIISAGLPVRQYSCLWDFAAGRVGGLEEFGQAVLDDLWGALSSELGLGSEPETPMDWFADEAAAMEAYAEERAWTFGTASREGILQSMIEFTQTTGDPNILLLTGAPGSGRSALLAALWERLRGMRSDTAAFISAHFVGASRTSTSLLYMLRRLCHCLAEFGGDAVAVPDTLPDVEECLSGLLASVSERRIPVVLLLDGLEDMEEAESACRMAWLPTPLPPAVRILATVSSAAGEGTMDYGRAGLVMAECPPLTIEDAADVVTALLARYSKSLEPGQLHALLSKADATQPLYLRVAVEELRQVGRVDEVSDVIHRLPGSTAGLFDWMLARLEGDFGADLVAACTGYIALGRRGMPESDVELLCAQIAPPSALRMLQRALRSYLVFRGEAVDYCQAQLRRAVEARYLAEAERPRAMHREIAAHFRDAVSAALGDRGMPVSARALADLPYHARRGDDYDTWLDFMTDFAFLQDVVEYVDVGPGLAADGSTIVWHGGYFAVDDELAAWLSEHPAQVRGGQLIEPLDRVWDMHQEFVRSADAVAPMLYRDLMAMETDEPREVMDRENRRFVMQGGPLWTWCQRERQKYEDPARPWSIAAPAPLPATATTAPSHTAAEGYDVFISYRREGGADAARLIRAELKLHGIRAFLDVDDLGACHFDVRLLHEIERAPSFIVVLSEGSLSRCINEGDWLRREIAHAIATDRNVVPVMTRGFSWPDPEKLPPEMRNLPRYNGVLYVHEYGEAAMEKLLVFLTGIRS